jgi:hypothetical protein
MTVPHDEDGGVGKAKLSTMISTDFVARSLDILNVTHIINFDLPIDGDGGYNAYIHNRGGEEHQPTLPWPLQAETPPPLLLLFLLSLLLSSPLLP